MTRANKSTSEQQLKIGEQTITYTLTFAQRKTVGITIRPNATVDVRAPQGISLDAVREIVQQRAPWILKNVAKFAQRPANQRPPSDPKGLTYLFLGRRHSLKIQPLTDATKQRERVEFTSDGITVWVKEPQQEKRVETLLVKWSRDQAEAHFFRRMATLFTHLRGYPVQLPNLELRRMKARWGSCSTNGTVTLNTKLIHYDEHLIDYVIMHELCHLIEHNHSKQFYALLARMMPDWEARRERLNGLGMPE